MPLPSMKFTRRCRAKSKSTGNQCHNPAAFGTGVCRVHGARRPESIRRGSAHPNYQHGERTQAAELAASQSSARLRDVETLARAFGLLTGPRTRGRKPIGN